MAYELSESPFLSPVSAPRRTSAGRYTPITKLAIIPGLAAVKEKSAGGTNRKRNSDGVGTVEAVGCKTR